MPKYSTNLKSVYLINIHCISVVSGTVLGARNIVFNRTDTVSTLGACNLVRN